MNGNKILIVIDMQNDFVTDALANAEAQAITEKLAEKVKGYITQGIPVFFTRDTHGENYMETQEGHLLPAVFFTVRVVYDYTPLLIHVLKHNEMPVICEISRSYDAYNRLATLKCLHDIRFIK